MLPMILVVNPHVGKAEMRAKISFRTDALSMKVRSMYLHAPNKTV